ncbi:MAG: hypothetical protein H7067_14850 [Burkholderiales bacterium]|nr:hypothetical protein [Opitutaceae bacterium]
MNHELEVYRLTDLLRCAPVTDEGKAHDKARPDGTQEDFYSGMAKVHPTWRLPKEFDGLDNGHHGSHQFLVDDFVRACLTGALPPNHIWAAARYNLPGLVAHESALREGALLDVPDLGDAPVGSRYVEEDLAKLAPATPTWTLPAPSHRGVKHWAK